jgi:hypothetical protein
MKKVVLLMLIAIGFTVMAQKPNVFIYTDMSDKTLEGKDHGTVNDPDDISAMAGYLLMCSEFNTLGIVVASTHRKEHATTPNQGDWANSYFGKAYKADRKNLKKSIKGYPKKIEFVQSSIKESAERFNAKKEYRDLTSYTTVKMLIDAAKKQDDIINVLCWGSLTEPAILVKHCIETNNTDVLKKLRFIAHWTNSSLRQGSLEHPENVANCREDAAACSYLKAQALAGTIVYYELSAIGQHGIVSGSPKGLEFFDQFKVSALGKIFAEGKYAFNTVDDSDSATYWTLLGTYGVSLSDVASNGTNSVETERANEKKFTDNASKIRAELLRRAQIASSK